MGEIVFPQANQHAVVSIVEDELLDEFRAVLELLLERLRSPVLDKVGQLSQKAAARERVSSLAWPIANSSSNWSNTKTGRTCRPSTVCRIKLRRWKCPQSVSLVSDADASDRPPASTIARVTAAVTCSERGGERRVIEANGDR